MSILLMKFEPSKLETKHLHRKSKKQKKQINVKKEENECDMCSPYACAPGWIYACEDSWVRCPACTPPELY